MSSPEKAADEIINSYRAEIEQLRTRIAELEELLIAIGDKFQAARNETAAVVRFKWGEGDRPGELQSRVALAELDQWLTRIDAGLRGETK